MRTMHVDSLIVPVKAGNAAGGKGTGAAYENGQYNESAKSGYGYAKGQNAYQQRPCVL